MICWSMKMRIDSSRAGKAAATLSHQGLAPKGDTSQPRPGSVGWERVFHGQVRVSQEYLTPALAFFHNPLSPLPPFQDPKWLVGAVCVQEQLVQSIPVS